VPEGDSIHRIALRITPSLLGREPTRIWVRAHGDVLRPGMRIAAIEAVGKHLLVAVDPDRVLRIHLGMPGRIRQLEPARVRLDDETSAIVASADATFVWQRARDADWTRRDDPRFVHALARVGPDLLAPEPGRMLVDVLLDQSIASGLGNVFKSEVLFLRGLDPRRSIASIDDAELYELYALARVLMQASMRMGTRDCLRAVEPKIRAAPGERTWVYGRGARGCRRCGGAIVRWVHGEGERVTYACPHCQPALPRR
jgi:endonuclease VIII